MEITAELLKNLKIAEVCSTLFLTLSILFGIATIIVVLCSILENVFFDWDYPGIQFVIISVISITIIFIILTIKYTGDCIEYQSIVDAYKYQHENLLPIAPIN